MWYVYIVECADKSLYTGIGVDVQERIKKHESGKGSRYVRSRLPVRLMFQESFPDKSSALKREAEIKRWPRSEKLAFLKKSQV